MEERMTDKIVIDGRQIAVSGSDDAAYLQQIADYINGKIEDLRKNGNYGRQTPEDRRLMLLLNIADDYYQANKRAEEAEAQLWEMEEKVDSLRLELVHRQMKAASGETENE